MALLEAEARHLAEEMALKQAEMESKLQFNRSLHLEAHGLDHTLNITDAFTWSYFELLQWLGLDLPDFERMKTNRF
ncbi:hypothetical protein LSH36_293g03040 [Paralvinella palmiformis]|uniref:Uncharacterized protein n=1 Tax=Paralvinella palmiformis TaxID=53620 RepID=A0AAD9JJA3_9ANNE|nr:hypothetical protein LSH36_293g03040 [Paralvinella palmiformis]